MKIISATCKEIPGPGGVDTIFRALIRVSSDGAFGAGCVDSDTADSAIGQALDEAIEKLAEPLHASLRVAIEVKF